MTYFDAQLYTNITKTSTVTLETVLMSNIRRVDYLFYAQRNRSLFDYIANVF